jgi:hypothetical protein
LTSFEEHLDQQYGERGTPEREKFEEGFEASKLGGKILFVLMDMNWIGIPREGFGFSNNAIGKFGTSSFDKMIFEIKENITVNCIPRYL